MPLNSPSPHRASARAWLLVLLCGVAGMLFYLDRQTLSVLKTTLKLELGWTDTQYGWLVSAFMASYTLGYLVSGRWIDRWGTRRAMPVCLGVMSVAALGCGLAQTLPQMTAFRALLGMAEAGVVPAVMVAIVTWFPPMWRGTASTIKEPINIAGQIIATPVAVACTAMWGWRSAFFAPGVAGLTVALAWWWVDRLPDEGPISSRRVPAKSESYLTTLRRRELWGVIAARMVSDPAWFFLLYWEPGFLQERVGLSLGQLGRIGWIPTAVAIVSLVGFGMFSDRLIARSHWSPARSRRVILQLLALFAPVLVLLPFVHRPALAIALLCVVRVVMVVWLNFSNLFITDLVPHHVTGTALALMSACGAAMGLLCNSLIAPVVSSVGYGVVFATAGCLHPLAALILWRVYRTRRDPRPQPAAAVPLPLGELPGALARE
ncbi:MAG TPA: MFS transporter [Dehalococcoidia bacterium]|nr:MFS transporter [Dehalococcoidia bacterium]